MLYMNATQTSRIDRFVDVILDRDDPFWKDERQRAIYNEAAAAALTLQSYLICIAGGVGMLVAGKAVVNRRVLHQGHLEAATCRPISIGYASTNFAREKSNGFQRGVLLPRVSSLDRIKRLGLGRSHRSPPDRSRPAPIQIEDRQVQNASREVNLRTKVRTSPAATEATISPTMHPVRAARTAAGFTQQSLGDAIGVTRQTIISIEGGEYAPSVILAIRIARVCNASVEELWGPAADAASEQSI
jgi:putative transcriptional regulator